MIRFAQPKDHPQLKALWMDAFGDSKEAVDAYFALRHKDENLLADVEDGKIAGMLTLLPVTLRTGSGQACKARYIYAVATGERFRSRGISTGLMEAAHQYMETLGETAGILVPASPSLFDFYGNRGYTTAFSLDVASYAAAELPSSPPRGAVTPCSAEAYTAMRDRAFSQSRLYAQWDEPAIAYAMHIFARTGGIAAISWEGGEGCAAWEQTEDGVLVKELALLRGDFQSALAVLHARLQADRYMVRLAQGTVPGIAATPFGMIHWLIPQPALTGKPPYLSFALD